MRSLKNLINPKKVVVDRNTGDINLLYPGNLSINDFNIFNTVIITNGGIVFDGLPISPIGLTEGSVWRDGEGILRIVWFYRHFLVILSND